MRGDACVDVLNVRITRPKISIRNPAPPPGDEAFQFSGALTVPSNPTIDPVTQGVRAIVVDAHSGTVVDVTVPPGLYSDATRAGWIANTGLTSWTYKNAGTVVPLIQGIDRVRIRRVPAVPGLFKFSIQGKTGTYPVANPAGIPLTATLILTPPTAPTGACGLGIFPGPAKPFPTCGFNASGTQLRCR
jgi:hypothetical protein